MISSPPKLAFILAVAAAPASAGPWAAPWPAGTPLVLAQLTPGYEASVDAAIAALPAPLAFASGLALVDARLAAAMRLAEAGDAAAAAQIEAAAVRLAALSAPTRFQSGLAEAKALVDALSGAPDPGALAAARETLDALRSPALDVGNDPTLNRLNTVELLLQAAAGLYAEAVGPDGQLLDAGSLAFARGAVAVAGEIYATAQRDLDSRVQSVTAGLTSTLRMIDSQFETDPAAGLPPPDQVTGTIAFFLGYSAYF